jgi:hypothetical protein
MVEVKSVPKVTLRGQNMQAKLERVARHVPPPIRVDPRDDGVRKYIKHLPSKRGFPASGPALWPNDNFTARRLRDGSVTRAKEEKKDEKPQSKPQSQPQSQAKPTTTY